MPSAVAVHTHHVISSLHPSVTEALKALSMPGVLSLMGSVVSVTHSCH